MTQGRGGRNPMLPLEHHVPDGEARVMPDGRLYVYGSYDTSDDWYCSDRYHVVSTADLREWRVASGLSLADGCV